MKDLPITMEDAIDGWLAKTGGYAKDMMLRDAMAIAAMQQMIAIHYKELTGDGENVRFVSVDGLTEDARMVAEECYGLADAMLEVRHAA